MAASASRTSPRSASSGLSSPAASSDSERSITSAHSLASTPPSTISSKSSDACPSPSTPKSSSIRSKKKRKDSSSDCEILETRPPIFENKSEPRRRQYANQTNLYPELDSSPSSTNIRHKRSTSDTRYNRPSGGTKGKTADQEGPHTPDPVWLTLKELDSLRIDVNLAHYILAEVPKKIRMSKEEGIGEIYIFRATHPKWSGKLKIGMTGRCFTEREKEICKGNYLGLKLVWCSGPVANAFCVEKLVHLDLDFWLRQWECGVCKNPKTDAATTHREWFEVPEELAKKTVKRWVAFMDLEPYSKTGSLASVWKDRVLKMREWADDHRKMPEKMRWDHWTTFVEPLTAMEHFVEKKRFVTTHPVWPCLRKVFPEILLLLVANFLFVDMKYMIYADLFHFSILISSHWRFFPSE